MMKLNMILSFIGTLIPVLFPDKKFNPGRLIAVVVIIILLSVAVHFLGLDNTAAIVDLTGDAVELTTE